MLRYVVLGLVLLPLIASCGRDDGGNALVVTLQTDLVAGEEFDRAQLTLFPLNEAGEAQRQETPVHDGAFFPAKRLTEVSGIAPGAYRLDVQLEDGRRDVLVAKRPVLIDIDGNVSITVPISRSCAAVSCPPVDDPNTSVDESTHTACFGGQCVDARCTLETPEFCGEGVLCDASKNTPTGNEDCAVIAECARGECKEGVCWATARDAEVPGACDASIAWCQPESGCQSFGEAGPSCVDGVLNGAEEGVDCGGPCAACPSGLSSFVDETCRDGEQNHGETKVDCGGGCAPCPTIYDCHGQSQVAVHECVSLVALYEQTNGANWEHSDGWLSGANPCDWYGVTCVADTVTEISFWKEDLVGTIPLELANLQNLRSLILNWNSFNGGLPPELGLLSKLEHLAIHRAGLSGSIPPEFGRLRKLRHLDLDENGLTGSIPESLGDMASLEILYLDNNVLRGSIPASLGQLSKLRELTMVSNNLSGELPAELGNLRELTRLNLPANRFTGTIPVTFGNLTKLEVLSLYSNDLTGSIPSSLSGLRQLRFLYLHACDLQGEVPAELATLPMLGDLSLDGNVCLWATDCVTLKPWLDGLQSNWSTPSNGENCTRPQGACF